MYNLYLVSNLAVWLQQINKLYLLTGADKTDTGEPAPRRQQLEKECGEETMETENVEDPEISFKKQAKHEPQQADVDAKKEARDVNRNSEAISANNQATCSAWLDLNTRLLILSLHGYI